MGVSRLCTGLLAVQLLGSPLLAARPSEPSEDVLVFTANQSFMSRIYLMHMDGTVITWFHYDPYRFVDLEVVNNELYAAEAFAPRVLKVDLYTGALEVIVDDWSLYYFYGLAFDGTHWYVDEWDLNRYEFGGEKDGVAPFDEEVMGAAWDGEYLWTLNHEENRIKCWSLSAWPQMIELPALGFAPPTPACRGLWYDGEQFFSAESLESTLGQIYRFERGGTVVEQWTAPAFRGWGVAVVRGTPLRLTVSRAELSWTRTLGAHSYDVVQGDLGLLHAADGGLGASVRQCLDENRSETTLPHLAAPWPGQGFWYLVRGVSDARNLSYDSGGAAQAEPRDTSLDSAVASCG